MITIPGERTPDQSPSGKAGSTDDEISLREHIQRQLDTQARYAERLHMEQAQYFERVISEYRTQLDERYATQTKALDAAFAAAKEAVTAALAAAETAVAKAEAAADRRFESVNEFRGQLNDQSRTFITRDESLSRHDRTTEALAEMSKRHDDNMRQIRERIDRDLGVINSRLDLGQGRATGIDKAWGYVVGLVGLAGGIVGLIIATR